MDIRVGRCIVIAQTMDTLYEQQVEYCCGSLLSSLVNTQLCCSNHSLEQHLQYAYFSKALSWLSSSRDYKRTQQGTLTALFLYLYKYNVVHAITISTCPKGLMSNYSSTMLCPCALTSYSLISITMHAPCVHHEKPMSLDITPNPNSFQTLPSPSRP